MLAKAHPSLFPPDRLAPPRFHPDDLVQTSYWFCRLADEVTDAARTRNGQQADRAEKLVGGILRGLRVGQPVRWQSVVETVTTEWVSFSQPFVPTDEYVNRNDLILAAMNHIVPTFGVEVSCYTKAEVVTRPRRDGTTGAAPGRVGFAGDAAKRVAMGLNGRDLFVLRGKLPAVTFRHSGLASTFEVVLTEARLEPP